MSDFDTRPKGTVIHGAFHDFSSAERALRVLKNAGYVRAEVDPVTGDSRSKPVVVTVDAAATGAARAAEILREYGAELRYASEPETETTRPVPPQSTPPLSSSQEPALQQPILLESPPPESVPQEPILLQSPPPESVPQEAILLQSPPPEAVPQQAILLQSPPPEAVPPEAVPPEAVPQETVPQEAPESVPQEPGLQEAVPQEPAPPQSVPQQSAVADTLQIERKPRIRKNARSKPQELEVPLSHEDVTIRTRGSDVMPLGESFASTERLTEET